MATPAEIITQIETQLKASSYLSDVKEVMQSLRDRPTATPSIYIRLMRNSEQKYTYPRQLLSFETELVCFVKTFKADDLNGACLALENNIKKALFADQTLNGLARQIETPQTEYDDTEYPIMMIRMIISIEYEQNAVSRT